MELTESPGPLPIVVEVWRMWGRGKVRAAQLVSNLEFPHFKLSLHTRLDQTRPVSLTITPHLTIQYSVFSIHLSGNEGTVSW